MSFVPPIKKAPSPAPPRYKLYQTLSGQQGPMPDRRIPPLKLIYRNRPCVSYYTWPSPPLCGVGGAGGVPRGVLYWLSVLYLVQAALARAVVPLKPVNTTASPCQHEPSSNLVPYKAFAQKPMNQLAMTTQRNPSMIQTMRMTNASQFFSAQRPNCTILCLMLIKRVVLWRLRS